MRLKGILLIPRIDGFFELKEAQIFRGYGFRGFNVPRVRAAYPGDGYGVCLILESSQVDVDFGLSPRMGAFFLAEDAAQKITEAFRESDRLTEKLLGRGWMGPRPYMRLEHFC